MLIRVLYFLIIAMYLALAGAVTWLINTPWGAQWIIREAVHRTIGGDAVSWDRIDGSLLRGVRVEQLEVRRIPYLPLHSTIRVQSLTACLTRLSLDGVDVELVNLRLFLVDDEAIVCNVRLTGQNLSGNAYARGFELGNVRDILRQFFNVPYFKGAVRDVDLFIRGTITRPEVKGHFFVERLSRQEMLLEQAPIEADLYFVKGLQRWQTFGKLYAESGSLTNRELKLTLSSSRLIFTGRLPVPELDIHASTKIKHANIEMRIQGLRTAPKIELSSDPPYPREQIMLMLATGKRWSGVSESISTSEVFTPALSNNVVDYLLFGGERGKIIKALGLSDISIMADEKKRGVVLSKDLTEKLGVGYGLSVGGEAQSQRSLTQSLQGEYYLTDKFSLGAQKEVRSEAALSTSASGDISAPPEVLSEKVTDDRIFLKYRSAF